MSGSPSEPRPLASVESWDAEADVVIVGYGGAGACAAIEASRAGARVMVLERASGGGGTTAIAAGHLYLGGGTRVQKACGFEDSADNMFDYIMQCADDPDEEKARLYCDRSVEHFDWLVSLGVPFKDSIYEQRCLMQPTDDGLIWSGNEKAWPFREKAAPAPRGHKVAQEDDAGPLLFAKLHQAVEAGGAEIRYDASVLTLVVGEGGRVAGAIVRQDGREQAIRARRGVILCAGGFAMNESMVSRHMPHLVGRAELIGNPYDDGAGIQMGMAARGAPIHMSEYHITLPFYPPASLTRGILVNAQGQRFVNEDSYHGRVGEAACRQPGGSVYLIADDACFGWPEMGFELAETAETIAELEAALGLPESMLQHTVEVYNRGARQGVDPLFHKQAEWLAPLDHPPFAALECSFGKASYIAFTLGGLHTRPDGEVLTTEGRIVPGLFAAGRTACGIPRSASGYASGTCIGDATFFGRLAGRAAALATPWDPPEA